MLNLFKYFRQKRRRNNNGHIGIALSGGGARGVVHIGFLRALEEEHIVVDEIAGTSMGAIIGAFYAAGHTPDEMLTIVSQQRFSKIFRLSWLRNGLLNLSYLEELIKKHIPHDDFEKLHKKLYVCATNLSKSNYEILETGSLSRAVTASAALPVIFKPIEINGQKYVDGGLMNNLPVQPIKKTCKKVIGVHVNNYTTDDEFETFGSVLSKVFTLAVHQNVVPNIQQCDYIVEPVLDKAYSVMDFSKSHELHDIGYEEGKKFIKNHKRALVRRKKTSKKDIKKTGEAFVPAFSS